MVNKPIEIGERRAERKVPFPSVERFMAGFKMVLRLTEIT